MSRQHTRRPEAVIRAEVAQYWALSDYADTLRNERRELTNDIANISEQMSEIVVRLNDDGIDYSELLRQRPPRDHRRVRSDGDIL